MFQKGRELGKKPSLPVQRIRGSSNPQGPEPENPWLVCSKVLLEALCIIEKVNALEACYLALGKETIRMEQSHILSFLPWAPRAH